MWLIFFSLSHIIDCSTGACAGGCISSKKTINKNKNKRNPKEKHISI
jgi:hypothetical protein